MNKFLLQKRAGGTILLSELLSDIPPDEVLLELFPNPYCPGHVAVTHFDLVLLKLRLDGFSLKRIAETFQTPKARIKYRFRMVISFLSSFTPTYIDVDIPALQKLLRKEIVSTDSYTNLSELLQDMPSDTALLQLDVERGDRLPNPSHYIATSAYWKSKDIDIDEAAVPAIEDFVGEIRSISCEAPGVYHFSSRRSHEELPLFGEEGYLVDTKHPTLSSEAQSYGVPIPDWPTILFYRQGGDQVGIIAEYEVLRYKIENGIPLEEWENTKAIALFGAETFPKFFGAILPPVDTPWGEMLRYRTLATGIFWLETNTFKKVLALAYPMWVGDISEDTQEMGTQTEYDKSHGIHKTMGYLFFTEEKSCIPLFELLTNHPEWEESGLIEVTPLKDRIWKNYPDYAVVNNFNEQVNAVWIEGHAKGSGLNMERIIPSSPDAEGSDYLHIDRL